MKPKEKATELINKFKKNIQGWDYYSDTDDSENQHIKAKESATDCVNEIILSYASKFLIYPKEFNFWQEVKNEIEKL